MSRKGPTKNQYSQGLTYVAHKPAFLKNFGQPKSPSPDKSGREPLPERPREGKWAGGSDDEAKDDGDDDEWGETFGGGGEEGPQVVVLKEGRHLTAEDVKRERRRAAGKPSQSPPPASTPIATDKPPPPTTTSDLSKPTNTKVQITKPITSSAKRKLVGGVGGAKEEDTSGKTKKKKGKGMLSFNEAEGEI